MEATAMESSGYGGHEEQKEETKPAETMKKEVELPSHGHDQQDLKEKELIESARAEIGQVMEENQRLKQYLDQIMRDYKTLQTQFINTVKKDDTTDAAFPIASDNDRETELVSLSLGRSGGSRFDSKTQDHDKIQTGGSNEEEGLRLRLLSKPSPTTTSSSSFEEAKEGSETVFQSKGLKMGRSAGEDHEVSNNQSNKRARVSVRARCDTPTMNDGCQWRKYGQKIAKGNPCPRAYYRCTVAPSCPVRKQVQRCADDMSILITTYEGNHNHPLPMSATAMASTTSAAAQMLLSGSSSSAAFPSSSSRPRPVTDLHGLTPYLDQYSKPTTMRPSPFYFPTTSISSSSSCPTITLDLTTPNPSSSSSNHFTRFNPSSYSSLFPPSRPYTSASLSFNTGNSSDPNPRSSPFSWPLGISNGGIINSYGQNAQLYGKSQETSRLYQPYNGSNSTVPSLLNQQDTIAAATKAITADPIFQTALAAALKSIINKGDGSGEDSGNHRPPQ